MCKIFCFSERPATSLLGPGAWAIYLSKDGEGHRGRVWSGFVPGPRAVPAPITNTSPLECLQCGVGQGLGKGEVEGRKTISWLWGDGEGDKVGVLSLGLGSGPWAGGRAQGLGWAEQQEEKRATDSLTSCSVRPGPAPPAWRRHALDGKGARMPLCRDCYS